MAAGLRARLQSIVNQPSDDRFLEEYGKLLEEIGLRPALWHGSDLPLGSGYRLRRLSPAAWTIVDVDGHERPIEGRGAMVLRQKELVPIELKDGDALLIWKEGRAMVIGLEPLSCRPIGFGGH